MTTIRRWVLAAVITTGALSVAHRADARICAPGMYCPTFKVTLRSFASHLGGCNDGGGCGLFRVSNTLTMSGTGEERNCMFSEPCGNIVAIYPDGSMDWSANGTWQGPPY